MSIWQKSASNIFGEAPGVSTIEGQPMQTPSAGVSKISEETPLQKAVAEAEYKQQIEVAAIGANLQWLKVAQLVRAGVQTALNAIGRIVTAKSSVDEDPTEGHLLVDGSMKAGGYFISRDADGDDWYLWQDVSGYWRVCFGRPVSDTDGQVVGPIHNYRNGADVVNSVGKGMWSFEVTRGVIDIDGITRVNLTDATFSIASGGNALWEGIAAVANSWYFAWGHVDDTLGFGAIVTRLSQATSVTATTLVDSTAAWIPDQLIGSEVGIVYGTGSVNWYEILDNDATSLAVATWVTLPVAANSYYVIQPRQHGYLSRLIGQMFVRSSGIVTDYTTSNYLMVGQGVATFNATNQTRQLMPGGDVVPPNWIPILLIDHGANLVHQVHIIDQLPTRFDDPLGPALVGWQEYGYRIDLDAGTVTQQTSQVGSASEVVETPLQSGLHLWYAEATSGAIAGQYPTSLKGTAKLQLVGENQ